MKRCLIVAGLVLLGLVPARTARADVTYTYTGNDLDSYAGVPPCTDCSIDGSITLSSPLPANQSLSEVPADDVVAFDFYISPADCMSGGPSTACPNWSNSNGAYVYEIYFGTNSSGQITTWDVEFYSPSQTYPGVWTNSGGLGGPIDDYFTGVTASYNNNPGTWVTPEPSSLLLFGTGIALIGMAMLVRRRMRVARARAA
jgi:hypothetical protein